MPGLSVTQHARRKSGEFAELAGHVRLVGISAIQRELRQRKFRLSFAQADRSAYTACLIEDLRRQPDFLFEPTPRVALRQMQVAGQGPSDLTANFVSTQTSETSYGARFVCSCDASHNETQSDCFDPFRPICVFLVRFSLQQDVIKSVGVLVKTNNCVRVTNR